MTPKERCLDFTKGSLSGGALKMQDRKMGGPKDGVENAGPENAGPRKKRRTFDVRYSEQTRKTILLTSQHCRVTPVRLALMALWAVDAIISNNN